MSSSPLIIGMVNRLWTHTETADPLIVLFALVLKLVTSQTFFFNKYIFCCMVEIIDMNCSEKYQTPSISKWGLCMQQIRDELPHQDQGIFPY